MPRALVPLLAITFVDVLGFTILIPILPFYAEHFGASPTTIGAIYATLAVCSLLSSPFWGRLSDRIGRKGVLIAAQVAGLLGFSLLAAGTALWTIFVARAIEGLGGGGLGVTQAYVTDVTTPAQRARAFGLVGATFGLGFLIGPALAGFLVRFGYQVPFWVAAGLAALTVVLTMVLLPESKGAVKTAPTIAEIRTSLRSPVLGRLIVTQFAFALAFTSWVTVFALFAERVLGFGPFQTANIFIVSSIVAVVVQAGFIGKLVDRYGEGRIAVAGLVCAVFAYAGIGFVTSTAMLLPFVVLWSLSGALIRPSLGALISDAAPADQRGTILSVNDSLNNLAFLISPFISTTVLRFNPHLTGIVPATFAFIAIVIGYRMFVASRPRPVAEAVDAA
ncbi:MAG: transporter, family, tetracycline resistance protein [Candidatus Eremiobacteraeota bacterium]|nr:transporter, family, tetracycline resistance protein [Candidatus Eremiobacteraeota bacterium]